MENNGQSPVIAQSPAPVYPVYTVPEYVSEKEAKKRASTVHRLPNRKLYGKTDSGEYVMRWPGVVAAVFIYILYIFAIPLLVESFMISSFSIVNPDADYDTLAHFINSSMSTVNMATYIITAIILLLVYGRFYWDCGRELIKGIRPARALKFLWVPVVACVGVYFLEIIFSLISVLFVGTSTSENQEAVTQMAQAVPLETLFLVIIMAPLVEETLFRGAWFRPIWYKNKWVAIIVTCVLFCLHHVWDAVLIGGNYNDLVTSITYIPAALGFILGYCLTKSLYGAMACHAANNLMAILMMYISMSCSVGSTASEGSVGLITKLAIRISEMLVG